MQWIKTNRFSFYDGKIVPFGLIGCDYDGIGFDKASNCFVFKIRGHVEGVVFNWEDKIATDEHNIEAINKTFKIDLREIC